MPLPPRMPNFRALLVRFFAVLFFCLVSVPALAAIEELPAMVLREDATGASIPFDHACLLHSSTVQAPACAMFQKNEAPADEEIKGKRTALVHGADGRYFSVALASIEIPGRVGESRARAVSKRMDNVTGSMPVTLGENRFLRVTSEFSSGASVMFLAIDDGDRQLAIDFSGPKGEHWTREELEATAASVMTRFSRPAPATPSPIAQSATSAGAGLLVMAVLFAPVALVVLRIVIRRAIRRSFQSASHPPTFQVAGADCTACSESIVFERDAIACLRCGGLVHHRCALTHRGAHGAA